MSIISSGFMISPAYGGEIFSDLKCYIIFPATFDPSQVRLDDQFGSETVELDPDSDLCVPVLKNPLDQETPPESPHFVVYPYTGTIDPPPVQVTDQFGTTIEDPSPAIALLVGALKNQPGQTPPDLHYIVYPISSTIDPPTVLLRDQFTDETVDLGPVNALLVPALKNGEGSEELPHYRCYDMPATFVPSPVIVTDQFGERQVTLENAPAFCAIADKIPIREAVGGEMIPLDSTMILLAGTHSVAAWMIPVIISGIGFAIVILRKL